MNHNKKGKLIVIEGTDCSGKETQSNLLLEKLIFKNFSVKKMSFPNYDSPTGKIIAKPYLGKDNIFAGYFPEGAVNVDPKVAALYYAADRRYNSPIIKKKLNSGVNILLDRYISSNMAHQGCKLKAKNARLKMYQWLETLEYEMLKIPRPDLTILLYMPYKYACKLKENRKELPDEHESNEEHLLLAEKTYLELAELYNFKIVNCVENNRIKSIEEIHEEVFKIVHFICNYFFIYFKMKKRYE